MLFVNSQKSLYAISVILFCLYHLRCCESFQSIRLGGNKNVASPLQKNLRPRGNENKDSSLLGYGKKKSMTLAAASLSSSSSSLPPTTLSSSSSSLLMSKVYRFFQFKKKVRRMISGSITRLKSKIKLLIFTIFFTLSGSLMHNNLASAAAVSGGRMGGSFGRMPTSSTRSSSSLSHYNNHYYHYQHRYNHPVPYYNSPTMLHHHRSVGTTARVPPKIKTLRYGFEYIYKEDIENPGKMIKVAKYPNGEEVIIPKGYRVIVRKKIHNVRDAAYVTGLYIGIPGLIFYEHNKFIKNFNGMTIISLTLSMLVPKKRNSDTIIRKLNDMATKVDTRKREGVVELIKDVATEIERNDASIYSGAMISKFHADPHIGARAFTSTSIRERSKFNMETFNIYGGRDNSRQYRKPNNRRNDDDDYEGNATNAVITINLALGSNIMDEFKLPKELKTRDDLQKVLSYMKGEGLDGSSSSDGIPLEQMVNAEVLWSPTHESETLTNDDIYRKYPDLNIIL